MNYRATRLNLFVTLIIASTFLVSCVTKQTSTSLEAGGNTQPVLKVGVSTNAPPLVYKSGGKFQGLEIDFANQLGTYLGRNIRFVELAWDKQIPALESGKIDIIMSGMTVTKKRQYRVAFAKAYMRSGQMLLVTSDKARLYSRGIYSLMGSKPKIGTIRNTTGDFFITKTINRGDITRFSTSKRAVQALIKEEIDVVVHDAPVVCHYAALYENKKLTPIMQMATEEYLAWAVNKMNSELLGRVNGFIEAKAADKTLHQTITRWIPYLSK